MFTDLSTFSGSYCRFDKQGVWINQMFEEILDDVEYGGDLVGVFPPLERFLK